MACSCAHPAHEHRAISRARGPAARTQRALKLATAALAATAGVPAPKPHLPASRLASALTLCASDSVSRCRLQRCELPILMLMLALPTNGLFALRCVDALAPLLILLFNFFDLLTIGTLISQPAALRLALREARPPLPPAARAAPRPATPAAARLSAAHPAAHPLRRLHGVVGAAAVQLHEQMPVGPRGSSGRGGVGSSAAVVGGPPHPAGPSLRTKQVCDITIDPFPRRTPPVKSSVSVLNIEEPNTSK